MAQNLQQYDRNYWVDEMPITAARTNKAEEGIRVNRDALITMDNDIDAMKIQIQERPTTLSMQSYVDQQVGYGTRAYTEVVEAHEGDAYSSLTNRFATDEANITAIKDMLGTKVNPVTEESEPAYSSTSTVYNAVDAVTTTANLVNTEVRNARVDSIANKNYDSLYLHLRNIDININNAQADILTIENAAGENNTLASRMAQLDQLQLEVDAARRAVSEGEDPDTLAKRFASIDAQIQAIQNDISGLGGSKVNISDIIDNLTSNNTNKPLSANMGKTLRDLIGGVYDAANTVTAAINAAETSAKAYTDQKNTDYHVAEINEAHRDSSDTLDARFDDIETEIDAAHRDLGTDPETEEVIVDSLNKRFLDAETDIAALQTEIAATHSSDAATLNARLQAIETNAATLASNLHSIATELAMLDDQDAIKNTNTKIDDLEADVQSFARELAMSRDDNGRLVETSTRVDTLETQASNMASAISHAAEGNDPGGLTERIVALETEPKSATEVVAALPQTGDATKDYLVGPNEDGKYFYYKWIANEWQLISGDSGGGSSSALIVAALPEPSAADANIDYYVGNSTDGYTHYRFIAATAGESEGHFIRILPNNLIGDISVDQYGGLVAHTINDNQTNLLTNFYALNGVTYTPNYDPNDASTLVSQTLQFTGTDGQQLDPIVIIGGGGGGGTVYSVNIESPTPASRSIPSNSTDPVIIQAKVVMKQGNELLGSAATAEGYIQYRQYGASTWQNGDRIEVDADDQAMRYVIPNNTNFTVDVTKYLVEDKTMQIRLAITAYPGGEGTDVIRYQTFSISKVNISIAAEVFDYGSVKNSNFQFNYRCFGAGIAKTVHFLIDNEDVVTPVAVSGDVLSSTVLHQIIPMSGKTNGMHTFQVYFVTSTGLESNKLNYFILYNTDAERQAPLIGAAAENNSIVDGDELVVNYSVNTIGSETTDSVEIELYTMEDGTKKVHSTTLLTDVDNNKLASPPYRTFDYPSLKKDNQADPDPDPITVYVKLTATHNGLSDSQTIAIQVRYLHTTYELSPITNNLLFSYNAYGRSNNDASKDTFVYPFTSVSGETINFTGTFNNFNWATDGYVDGESLIIGGGATLNINVPIFNSKFNDIIIEENTSIEKITTNGRTIEIDYEVLSTTNLGATIIDCMTTGASPKGFRVTPQNCYLLNSGSNIDIDETGFIKNEENVAAAYLNPGTRTHLAFVVEPMSTDGGDHQSVNIYVNGEFANACPYHIIGSDFDNNATITIGSDTCLIKLYSIKLYNRGLTEAQVLHNYEVAPVATRDKLIRLEENDILNNQGLVDYERARRKYTCLLLTGMGTVNGHAVPTMAPYKGYPSVVGREKDNEIVGKTESGLLLTKPTTENSNGYTVEFDLQDKLIDPNNLYGYASSNNVQGTSSQKFPVKNLKVYLAKGDDSNVMVFDENETISVKQVYKYSINTAAAAAYTSVHGSEASLPDYIKDCGANIATIVKNLEEVPTQAEVVDKIVEYLNNEDTDVGAAYSTYSTGDELIVHPIKAYKKSKKVKYALRDNGIGESTLCWKADYMSTDHANTFNANIANTLYSANDRLSDRWTDQTQFTIYGIKCLLFQKNGDGQPEFVGDGCLNNDKGNHATFGLEAPGDKDDNTMCQKWDFRNNTGSLLYFKHDGLFEIIDGKPAVAREVECIYPDEGDLADIGITPNYNHFQILSSWLGNRANYWYESDPDKKAAKKQIFIDEFRNHFNFNHILIYYLFMEYTALCDNRVKNIHMRTDNAGEERVVDRDGNVLLDGNLNPNSGPWTLAKNLETRTMQEPIMDENGDYQFDENGNMQLGNVSHVFVKDSVINSIDWEQGEGHSNFAIWAPVLYDLDSCFSADNVGYLKIRYDADWDYSLYNKLKFAGYDSILWLQVEDCFQDDLKVMAKKLYDRVVGLNYSTFYRQQITDNLASVCPAITNQDMILKYDKPWTEGFLDYSKNPPAPSVDEYKYLQRGTRTGQKAIFMKQRSLFLASKYDGNEFTQDKITFRAGTQVNHENSILTLTANQKLYPGAQFGDVNDTTKVTRRASKVYDSTSGEWVDINEEGWVPEFTPCQIQHSGNMNNTDGIEIYGASVLNDIGDISRFHPWQVKIGNAVNLKKLIIGSTTQGYSNTSTDKIGGLDTCVLLEEINVCNLKNLSSLQLSNNGFIKKVYATGSGLSTLALPRGGVLDTIAYGANTTDITIINQSRLTNFSYEDSSTNNYGKVTRLWIENTPNVPVREIITARLTSRSSEDQGLRIGGLRIVGIDLDLGEDPSFLQLITSDLVLGTYLTAQGGHVEGNNQPPYISGKIHMTAIRASLLAKVNEMYPDLIVYNTIDAEGKPNNNVKTEFTITYLNYDMDEEHPLYVDYRISTENVIDPAYDTNPITNTYYIDIPTKPEDAQYKYKFGTPDSSSPRGFKRFSGWVVKGTTTNPTSSTKPNGNITYVAYFPTLEKQQYTVRWFSERNGTELRSISVQYNDDLSAEASPVELGTLTRTMIDGNTKKVFSGWSRPLGKITSNVDVYALWETSTINNTTPSIAMETLTAADIYALSLVDSAHKAELLNDKLGSPIFIKMGQDFNYTEGVQMVNLLGNSDEILLDGSVDTVRVYNDIKPLAINSDWTIAIDYKLLMDSAQSFNDGLEFVLASCYQNANSSIQGFKISLVHSETSSQHAIQVTWGTASTTIDYALTSTTDDQYFTSYRNVVVLSHNSNLPNALRVSYVLPNTANSRAPINANFGLYVNNQRLVWDSNVAISTPLIIGGNYAGTTTTIEEQSYSRRPAQGVVYWAKFWDTDLGEANCTKLASWIHETVPFLLSGYNNGSTGSTEQIYTSSELSFVAAQGMGDRYFYARQAGTPDDNNMYGWHMSVMRQICNNLIYAGIPENYKSIIRSTPVNFNRRSSETGQTIYEPVNDYLFLPAYRELEEGTVSGTSEVNTRWLNPWHWMIPANLTVLQASTGSEDILESKTASSIAFFRYRFSGMYISENSRIFNTKSDPATQIGLRYRASDGTTAAVTIQPGDVWVNLQTSTAFIYISNEDISRGVTYDLLTTGGAWKRAKVWQLRTYNMTVPTPTINENFFMHVDYNGAINTNPTVSTLDSEGRLLCPEFTV